MSTRANYFKIGIFVITAAALIVGAIVILGVEAVFVRTIEMETYFKESVQGLDVGAPVKQRGVKIGAVKEIDFVRTKYKKVLSPQDMEEFGGYVVVRASIRPDLVGLTEEEIRTAIKRVVERGLRIQLTTQGVTGVYHLEAAELPPEKHPPLPITWEPEHPYIPSAPSTITVIGTALTNIAQDLDQADLGQVIENFDHLLISTTGLVKEIDAKRLNADMNQTFEEIQGTLEDARDLLQSPEVGAILTNAAQASEEAKRAITDLTHTAKHVRGASEQLPATLSRMNKTLRRLDRLIATKGSDFDEAIDNLKLASEDLRRVTAQARRYPSHLLFGDPPPRQDLARQ